MSKKLKVGVLINSYELSLWEYVLIERLLNSSYASVALVILNDSQGAKKGLFKRILESGRYIPFILFSKLDQKLFPVQPDAFESKDATSLLKRIPTIQTKPIATKFSDLFQDSDISQIKNHDLDVLIRLGFRIVRGDILKAAKYGIWSYHHGDNTVNRGGPPGFWEVVDNWDVTGTTLQILTEDLDAGRVLYRSFSQTDKRSVHRNRNNYYWKSLSLLPRKLEELYNIGDVAFFKKVDEQNTDPNFYSNILFSSNNLTVWRMIMFCMTHLLRFLKGMCMNLFFCDQWALFFDANEGLSTSFWRFRRITPPKDRCFADPFIIQKENKYFIFIEEFIHKRNKGHISMIAMDEKGNYEKPATVIEKSYHLSYPFIFQHKDNYFLIPESSSNRTIELYKCIEFPCKWEFQMNLMENIVAVNATVFFHQNKWWLFANSVENPGSSTNDELYVFYSEELCTTAWIPHPLNPVVSDVRKARPAGGIFIHDGKILRPSQDNSKPDGCGLKINEIMSLSEREYEETELLSIDPNWAKHLMATRTFNHCGGLTVIDGNIRRKRFF